MSASTEEQRIEGWLAEEAGRFGVSVSVEQAERIGRYVVLLSRWSERIRLTSSPDPERLVRRHVPDALALAQMLAEQMLGEQPAARCADVGAGNGLPGIVTAIVRPELEITLVEPRQRRVAFLRTAAHELSLGCRVVEARAEELEQGGFDVAWARATFPPQRWIEIGAGLVRPGGWVVIFTAQEERVSGEKETRRLCYELVDGTPRCLLAVRAEGADESA